ncbi:uncharacterized protein MELLADRAFT_103934 [Melampsora larici-populina 98AG31]|uniref:Uncharacterized protein n=1 Tax=Melampsora larici-populina (strain 98AG31 / pathotype 3-4-7) TaxID=747676 RepID=F4RD16_MELLP|nr:uncharacterized protein MELLADRAFT_103934 [Melampsora larici-populina 98AG31]EGG09893.1 hypothetical protein MELLADRAFT_103934 [Melampsora larici-populina 98AG31]
MMRDDKGYRTHNQTCLSLGTPWIIFIRLQITLFGSCFEVLARGFTERAHSTKTPSSDQPGCFPVSINLLTVMKISKFHPDSSCEPSSAQLNYQHHSLSNSNQERTLEIEWEKEKERESEIDSSNHPLHPNLLSRLNVFLSVADPASVSNHAGQVVGNTPQAGGFFSNPSTTPLATTPITTPIPTVPNLNTFVPPTSQLQSTPSIEAPFHHGASESNETLLPTGAIIGIVIGLILIFSLVPLVCLYFHRRKQKANKLKNHESFFNNPIINSTLIPNPSNIPITNQVDEYHFRGTPFPIGIQEHDYPKINHIDSNHSTHSHSPRRFDRLQRNSHHTSISSFNRFHHHDLNVHNQNNGRIDQELPIPLQVTDHSSQSPDVHSRNQDYIPNQYDLPISINMSNHPIQQPSHPREEYHIPIHMESIDAIHQDDIQSRAQYHLPSSMEVNHHNEQEPLAIEEFLSLSMQISIDPPREGEAEEEEQLGSPVYRLGHSSFDPDESQTMRFPSHLDLQFPEEVVIRNGPQMDAKFSDRPSSVQRIVSQIATTEQSFEELNLFKESKKQLSSKYPSTVLQSSTVSEDEITKKINQTLKDIQVPKEISVPKEIQVPKERNLGRTKEGSDKNPSTTTTTNTYQGSYQTEHQFRLEP